MDPKPCHQVRKPRFTALVPAVAALLILGASGCGKSPEEIKAAKAAHEAETTSRLLVKSNHANATIETTRVPAAGEPAPAPINGVVGQSLGPLPPGKYVLITRTEGWPEIRQDVTLVAGQTNEIAVNFKSGSLRLDSVPSGATVKIDGAVLGRTPLVVPQLPLGERKVVLDYPGWPALPVKLTINENVETAETVRLPHGKLSVASFPAGATVLFGGRALGQTPLTIDRFQAGTKKLTLQSKDFPPLEITITLEDQGEVAVSPALSEGYPLLEAPAFLREVWVATAAGDHGKTVLSGFRSQSGYVRNLDRKKLFESWLGKKFRFTGIVKAYNPASGDLEIAEEKNELTKYRLTAKLSPAALANREFIAQLNTKGAIVALYGRLSEVEEPEWPARGGIRIEFVAVEPQR